MVRVVAGITLKGLNPRVWSPGAWCYLPQVTAVIISYADFHRRPGSRHAAMEAGLRDYLDIPGRVQIFLDNGAFTLDRRAEEVATGDYLEFIERARPDWYPIPRDYIPTPGLPPRDRWRRVEQTMAMNRAFAHTGCVPIIHVGENLHDYLMYFEKDVQLSSTGHLGLGGIVPNLLRAPRARPYQEILENVREVRRRFASSNIHLFGVGGTATLHIAALLGITSADSSGWRNRAARGIIQLPGCGDRQVLRLGSWGGREPSSDEWKQLDACQCPACLHHGLQGLRSRGAFGFANRATHNLYVLLNEGSEITRRLADQTYFDWYRDHLDNSIYLPLIAQLAGD